MLVETYFGVASDEADVQDVEWRQLAEHLTSSTIDGDPGSAPSAAADTPQDAIVCLGVSYSPLRSLNGIGEYTNLLALAIPHCGLPALPPQVPLPRPALPERVFPLLLVITASPGIVETHAAMMPATHDRPLHT